MTRILEVFPLSNKSHREKFIDFQFDLYGDDPLFVTQPVLAQVELFKKEHPFHQTADVRFWLALDDRDKVVGRIAAILNHHYNRKQHEKVIFFGFFDFENDREVSRKLLEQVAVFGGEKGMTSILGPVNPSTNYEAACLVSGEADPPQIMMPYNYSYYAEHLELQGFGKAMDLYAYKRKVETPLRDSINRVADRAEKTHNITYRTISRKTFQEDIETIHRLYNQSWENNWGFVPMTREEFFHTAKDLKQILVDELVIFTEVKGKPVGFAVALPDYNQAFIKLKRGRLFPFGIFYLLRANAYIDRFRIAMLGVLPRYRPLGVGALLYRRCHKAATSRGYRELECSWILENNHDMNSAMEKLDGEIYKTYRIYQRALPSGH